MKHADRLVFSTADGDGFGAYHDLYRSGTSVGRSTIPFAASVTAHRFPDLLIFNRIVAGAEHHREALRVKRDGLHHYNLQVLRSGIMAAGRPGEEQAMRPGDVVLFDTAKPQRTLVERANYISVAIKRELIETEMPFASRLHGTVLSAATDGLLSDFLLSLGQRAATLKPALASPSAVFVGAALGSFANGLDLVRLMSDSDSETQKVQRFRAEAYIDANLVSRLLGPDKVAAGIGMSRSALYRLFEPTGGVAAFILSRRVARLETLLLRPNETRSIAELAHIVGFAQESHGSRAFKAAFGLSPGQFRDAALETPEGPDASRPSHGWADWWNDIA